VRQGRNNAAWRRVKRRAAKADGRRRTVRGTALGALVSSALAIPGLAGNARADAPLQQIAASYNAGYYVEDDMSSSAMAGGDPDRYEIRMHQFHLGAPLTSRIGLDLDVTHETMSGASPYFIVPDADGNPLQVMSGASIEDTRTDALLKSSYYFDRGRLSATSGVSVEKDYRAVSGGLEGELHFNDKNTTLSAGGGFSIDRIEPTDSDLFPLRPERERKDSVSAFAGVAQVLSRQAAIQSTVSLKRSSGFLADPYKQVLVAGNLVADKRPDVRKQISWLTRYRHHFSSVAGTLHADYQLYVDDWDVTSHTLELAWYQSLWDSIRLIPSFRYYSQTEADFYGPYFTELRRDHNYSSDYRLSPYGAISWGLKAETHFRTGRLDWVGSLAWERYESAGKYALQHVSVENPGLVSFNVFSIALSARF
jgi:hypothetical protein